MATFIDSNKNSWNVAINVRKLKGVRENVKDKSGKPVDLMETVTDRLVFTLLSDPCLVGDVLWYLCNQQAQTLKVSKESFLDSLWGEYLESATEALIEALADFFPKSEKLILQKIVSATKQILEAAKNRGISEMNAQAKQIKTMTPEELQSKAQQILESVSGS